MSPINPRQRQHLWIGQKQVNLSPILTPKGVMQYQHACCQGLLKITQELLMFSHHFRQVQMGQFDVLWSAVQMEQRQVTNIACTMLETGATAIIVGQVAAGVPIAGLTAAKKSLESDVVRKNQGAVQSVGFG
jgi:hypothetical protein